MNKSSQTEFETALKTQKKLIALFYASWCPFSRRFLPIYENCTLNSPTPCVRVMVDDREDLCEKYLIAIFPTVLVFEDGEVSKRLDGVAGEGLNEEQLKTFLDSK